MWRTALLGWVATAVLLIACGGGGNEASGLMTIHQLDLEDAELNPLYFVNQPPENDYPGVVATVNKVAITGDELASRQVMLELGRRQWEGEFAHNFPEDVVTRELDKIASTNPLEELIDEELERQAVVRLGLLPSEEEGAEAAREQQRMSEQSIAMATPEERAVLLQTLQQIGAPVGDWGADLAWVARFRDSRGLVKLRHEVCPKYETPVPVPTLPPEYLGFVNLGGGGDSCEGFLAQERKNADIVYYVRWAD